ncbi:fused protease/ribonucleoside-triphosphate reductase [Candidatus Woesearchaeota archaeon]|nr:fused protease/ribonucleoside-triphosphate reductase [Candidatus Woesearchaeota archaeon]
MLSQNEQAKVNNDMTDVREQRTMIDYGVNASKYQDKTAPQSVFFTLHESFTNQYKSKQPKWGPIGYVTYKRSYARSIADGDMEEYWQTVKRVVEGVFTIQKNHCMVNQLPWFEEKAQKSAQRMFELMWEFKFTPPGRGLWMMGTDYMYRRGGAALNNCAFCSTEHIHINFAEPFCFLMDMSMLGVGVGGDTKGTGKITIQKPEIEDKLFVVEDSREGWIELLRTVLNAYSSEGKMPAKISYDQVRPMGAPIKSFGGVASGPGPLIEMVDSIKDILDQRIGQKITSGDIVDVFNLVGRCVVSGGVRRTAEIMFGEHDDKEFMSLKDPEQHREALMHHRWASNNSVFAHVGMDYTDVAERTAKNGEPGYMWLDNAQKFSRMGRKPDYKDIRAMGGNPCLEQTLEPYELCCLVETYPSNHDTTEEWVETLKYAYLYAKTVTLVPTHNKLTNAVMLRNRRIGCSMSGITQAFTKFGRRQVLDACNKGYEKIQHYDKVYSEWLCVPRSIKTTSIKPSGTVSLLAGVTPGIHYPVAQYYIRNIRFQEGSKLLDQLRAAGYKCEKDKYSLNTWVVSFPVKEEYFDRSVDKVPMWEQLENAAQIQEHWADNQVSVTVTFSEEEGKNIKEALELYESRLKGVSFLPRKDHGYEQAPYIPISKEVYEELSGNVKPIEAFTEAEHEVTDKYCDSDKCML